MSPAYGNLDSHELQQRAGRLLEGLAECRLCPRQCAVNRLEGETGFCQTGRLARIASYTLHYGEEAPLVGRGGSGTIFFAGCNLGCLFCQNFDISHSTEGSIEAQPGQLAAVMLELQKRGAENINLVTPSHVVPQILEALPETARNGLSLPLVFNSSGYDELQTLRSLEGVVDIYMPDAKFAEPGPAERYCRAVDYPAKARAAILEMHRQVGDLEVDENGIARRGLLVRHLLMPDDLAGSEAWFRFLAQEVSRQTYLNIMDQYRPCGSASSYPELNRTVSQAEHRAAVELATRYGLRRLDRRERRSLRDLVYFLNR